MFLGKRFRFESRVPFWGSVFGPFSGPFGDPFSVPLGTHFRVHLETHLGTEKDHLQQLVNYQHSVVVSSLKCRVGANGHIAQSPSHSLSHPSDGFATTPARTAAVRASVNSHSNPKPTSNSNSKLNSNSTPNLNSCSQSKPS